MTEPELFAAYQHLAGYSAQCACGTWIDAPNQDMVSYAVDIHSESPEHETWRADQAAVEALRRPTVRRCPCRGAP